jgi:prepilin-type N-terminal cleavage/methylation domain-containing protein
MKTSPCKDSTVGLHGCAGFSLIEVMVTLAIISIVVSVSTVALSNSLQGARFAAQSKAAVNEMRNFRARALLAGQSAVIITDTSADPSAFIQNIWRLPLPEDWRVEGEAIDISASGMCLGGDLTITGPHGRRVEYRFSPPQCIPERIAAPVSKAPAF